MARLWQQDENMISGRMKALRMSERRMSAKRVGGRRINGKGQMWLSDFTISLLLFIVAALIAVKIIMNSFSVNSDFEKLKDDATKISEILLSEGSPANWTNDTVIRPGLLTGGRFDISKVRNAMNQSYINYSSMMPKLQTSYDFLVIFQEQDGEIINFGDAANPSYSIGNPLVSVNATEVLFTSGYDDLVKLTRLAVYDSRIVKMIVYAWR
jgi:hypothetical protein